MSRFPHPASLPKAERERRRKLALLSSARRQKFGALPDDAGVWSQQLQEVAADLGIAVTFEEMQSPARAEVEEP